MPLNKENINNFLPNGFETQNKEGYKENFSDDKIQVGYEKDVKDRVTGPNFNNLLDKIGKNFNTLDKYIKYLNGLKIGETPIVDNNNQLNSTTIGVKVHNLTETFGLSEWVVGFKDSKKGLFNSLRPNNIGHALTDTESWEEVRLGSSEEELAKKANVNADNFSSIGKSEIISWLMPDYSAGVVIDSGYTASADLFVNAVFVSSAFNRNIYINSETVFMGGQNNISDRHPATFYLSKGDTITWDTGYEVTVYPLKGAN